MEQKLPTIDQLNRIPLPDLQHIIDEFIRNADSAQSVKTSRTIQMLRSILTYRRGTQY